VIPSLCPSLHRWQLEDPLAESPCSVTDGLSRDLSTLGLMAAHETRYIRALSAVLGPAVVDLSMALGSGSVVAHAPPSIHGPSHTLPTLGCKVAHWKSPSPSYHHSSSEYSESDDDDALGGPIKGFGLVIDDAEFGAGACACTTFVDPWSGPSGTELDDACASDDPTGFLDFL
jgi:hypothetical protein